MASRLLALNCKHWCIWHNLTHIPRHNEYGYTRCICTGQLYRRHNTSFPCNVYVYIHYCISIMETYWIICFMSNITPMLNVQYILTHIHRARRVCIVQCARSVHQCLDYNLWNCIDHHNIGVVHSMALLFFSLSFSLWLRKLMLCCWFYEAYELNTKCWENLLSNNKD